MSEPSTVNCGIIVPNVGDLVNHWGDQALNPDFVAIDGYLGGVQTISVALGPLPLRLPLGLLPRPGGGPTQAQNAVLKFTGTLTTNVVVTMPLPGMHLIHNLTQGAFSLVLSAPGAGLSISTQPGTIQRVYNDGTNVYFVDLPAIGSFLDLCTTTVPAWINACTVPPYLYCNGAGFSGTTYPYLVGIIGGTTLPDLRGRARFFFNDSTGRITAAVSGVNGDALLSAGGDQGLESHQHAVNGSTGTESAIHTHAYPSISVQIGNGGAIQYSGPVLLPLGSGGGANASAPESTAHIHSMNFSSGATGAGGGQNMPPATISGITLIRAG